MCICLFTLSIEGLLENKCGIIPKRGLKFFEPFSSKQDLLKKRRVQKHYDASA